MKYTNTVMQYIGIEREKSYQKMKRSRDGRHTQRNRNLIYFTLELVHKVELHYNSNYKVIPLLILTEGRSVLKILTDKPKHRWEDNIRMDPKEMVSSVRN